MIPIYMNDSRH